MVMNQHTPHFSVEELKAIYAAATEKTKQGIAAAATQLYPEKQDALAALYWMKGGGRAFRDADGKCHKPSYTLQSWPNELGIMEDGTVLEY